MVELLTLSKENSQPHPEPSPLISNIAKPGRLVRLVEWTLVLLLMAYAGGRMLPRAWRTLNTDFPNYYLTARLAREHYDTSRVYEWVWIQRQKDHRNIDQRIVGMVPITPFSTLFVWPLVSLPPLVAKHYWIVLNLGLLAATLILIQSMVHLGWRRVLLITVLSSPLHANFLLGQYYVLLLFFLTLALWLYLRQKRFLAGLVVGLASGLKIFPILYLVYFLRKKDLKAFAGGIIGGVGTVICSVLVFGWDLHRTYFIQVLPSVFRGEGLDPYNLRSTSLSSLLHRLFVFEPQLNPHPALQHPWLFAVLHPLLQLMILAPALLLSVPRATNKRQLSLEWSALLFAILAISTSPASYLFTLLILPACLVWNSIDSESNSSLQTWILLFLYVGVGFLGGRTEGNGWQALLEVPRLYAIILLCALACVLLFRMRPTKIFDSDGSTWALCFSALILLSIYLNIHHQNGLYNDYRWRIVNPNSVYMATSPVLHKDDVKFIAMILDGYHSATERQGVFHFSDSSLQDHLSIASDGVQTWVESSGSDSRILREDDGKVEIKDAESPVGSVDGRWLSYLREDHGRTRGWVHALNQPSMTDKPVTPVGLNVLEMSFLPNDTLVFSAVSAGTPTLFIEDQAGKITPVTREPSRYPSASPNGQWLVYSELDRGNWNLWLRDLRSGNSRRLTYAACNDMKASWTADSQSLVYASDCGRALWFTALCKRNIFR